MKIELDSATGAIVIHTNIRGVYAKLVISENFDAGTLNVEARSIDKRITKAIEFNRKVGL